MANAWSYKQHNETMKKLRQAYYKTELAMIAIDKAETVNVVEKRTVKQGRRLLEKTYRAFGRAIMAEAKEWAARKVK